jgi:RimJ/RimL family protein N-acetyltransferase
MSIILKDLNICYLDDYLEMVNSEEVHKTTEPLEDFKLFSVEQIKDWLHSLPTKKDRKDFAIVKKETNEFVGEVVLNHIKDSNCNIRIALLPRFFNMGFGTDAIKLATEFAFKKLNIEQINLDVYSINPRGIRVYEKCGFKRQSQTQLGNNLYEIRMTLTKNQ